MSRSLLGAAADHFFPAPSVEESKDVEMYLRGKLRLKTRYSSIFVNDSRVILLNFNSDFKILFVLYLVHNLRFLMKNILESLAQ